MGVNDDGTYLTRSYYDELNVTSIANMDFAIEAECKKSRVVCRVPFWRSDYHTSKIRKAHRLLYQLRMSFRWISMIIFGRLAWVHRR
mmetsp:Transcript_9535/g.37150  ORF Transcript_9535/g.37150 Transcript_9535/m.37150 type:complete len:87 (+) Transcript_9535:1174-1434(+)